jgi:recombination protein RecA
LIQKSGSFFSYGETRLGQGRNNTKEFLRDNPELGAELERKIYEKLGIGEEGGAQAETEKPADADEAADEAKAADKAPTQPAEKPKPQKKAA